MVLESNRDLVLRRLTECLARDRTKHQVAEVTSLGLVQMTRKRVGAGLLEAFSTQCECCSGRGVILTLEAPAETAHRSSAGAARRPVPTPPPHEGDGNGHGSGNGRGRGNGADARPANGRSGNRRSGGRSDNDWRAPAGAVAGTSLDDTATGGALDTTSLDDAALDSRTHSESVPVLDSAPADTTSALDDAARNADAVEDTGSRENGRNGGRRTRRPTNGGTAFAAAVTVEDSPAPAVVVPVVTTDLEPTPDAGAFVSVPADATATDSEAPVRRTRTRAGSAVARVTIVTDPEPPAPAQDAPVTEAATESPAAAPDSLATAPSEEAPAEAAPNAEPALAAAPDLEAPAEVVDVPAFEAADAFAPPAEQAPAADQPGDAGQSFGTEQAPARETDAQPELVIEPDSAADSELAIEPDTALETFAASVVPTFEAAEAFTPATAEAEAEDGATTFAVDAEGEASPLPHAEAEGEVPQGPQSDAEGETPAPQAGGEGEA
jgi:ribonuclease E